MPARANASDCGSLQKNCARGRTRAQQKKENIERYRTRWPPHPRLAANNPDRPPNHHTRSGSTPITTLTTSPLCSLTFGLRSTISSALSSGRRDDPRCKQAGYDAGFGIRELLLLPLTAAASSLYDNQKFMALE